MDFKKISLFKFYSSIYFILLFVFLINIIFSFPNTLYFSKITNHPHPSPEAVYGASAFKEKDISHIGKLTSVYRGDFTRKGVYKKILPFNHLKVLWKSFTINDALHGASKASPAVDSSGVYVGGDDGWFYAFNHDGSVRWSYYTFYHYRGIHSTAMLTEKYVWFGSYNGFLYCLDKFTGKLIYSLKLADAIGSSPLLYKGHIYVSVETSFLNAYVVKINAKTGEVIWRSGWLGEQIHSSVSLNPKRRLLYVGANNGAFYAIHMDHGKVFWAYDAIRPIKGTPLVDLKKDRVYFSSWSNRLTSLDAGTGKVIWESYIHSTSQSSPTDIPFKNVLVVSVSRDDPALYGIRKSNGHILWKKKLNNPRLGLHSGFSAKNETGEYFYYGVCSDKTFCVIDPLTGKTLKEVHIGGLLTGVPVPYKSFIYLSLEKGSLIKLKAY